MRSPGDYALLHANGTSFAEIVQMIRDEQAGYLRTQGTEKDYKIVDVSGIDGGDSWMSWAVATEVGEAGDGNPG